METIAWISGVLLGACAVPEVYHTLKKRRNDSSVLFLLSWYLGEIGFFIYILPKKDYPLLLNYTLNIILITILLKFKIFPVDNNQDK